MKFNIRLEDIELRSCGKHLLVEGVDHDRAEIIQWNSDRETCYVLAYWTENKEGWYDMQFVGDRPFKADPLLFMRLAKQGQELLDDGVDHDEKNSI